MTSQYHSLCWSTSQHCNKTLHMSKFLKGKIYFSLWFQRFQHGQPAPFALSWWCSRNMVEEDGCLPYGNQEAEERERGQGQDNALQVMPAVTSKASLPNRPFGYKPCGLMRLEPARSNHFPQPHL